ncbi:hypothetical protein TNCV_1219451 [Trichonephila clavipes]|nr:hypothetical protein TNCV_1219451 [Trichonephila clavipes]
MTEFSGSSFVPSDISRVDGEERISPTQGISQLVRHSEKYLKRFSDCLDHHFRTTLYIMYEGNSESNCPLRVELGVPFGEPSIECTSNLRFSKLPVGEFQCSTTTGRVAWLVCCWASAPKGAGSTPAQVGGIS